MQFTYLVIIVFMIGFVYYYIQTKKRLERYSSIINIEDEILHLEKEKNKLFDEINDTRSAYKEKLNIYNKLKNELHRVEEEFELASYGFYKPTYQFESSEIYKTKLDQLYDGMKKSIQSGEAVYGLTNWTVDGSKTEGKKMTDRAVKLTVRAFNGECDSIISKVKWNNYNTMRERIIKSFEVINKLNASNKVEITPFYRDLKLEELRLTHEYHQKTYEEKEEQRAIREQMREEEKAQKELEKAQQDAEKEEIQYQKALQKVHEQLSKAKEEEMGALNAQIEELNRKLTEAETKKERALSMAQQTRSGHVYVISNIGSFGENIYKIGMTRRLEPLDRVRELGDASVPFLFDVHAMIYSKDAPKLEKNLHSIFNDARVNMVNGRKEFFNVSLDAVEQEVQKLGEKIEFTKIAEAREYRESITMKNTGQKPTEEDITDDDRFPEEL